MSLNDLKEALARLENAKEKLENGTIVIKKTDSRAREPHVIKRMLQNNLVYIASYLTETINSYENYCFDADDEPYEEETETKEIETKSSVDEIDEQYDYIDNDKCKHCGVELSCGYDKDDWYHCQGCHNIYDGYAQCTCTY